MLIDYAITLFPLFVGNVIALFTRTSIKTWYVTLRKPWFTPPNWLFPVAWTTLYISMGYASLLIYKSDHSLKEAALSVYIFQIILNFSWSPIFFIWRSILHAAFVIVILNHALIATAILFYLIDTTAGWLIVPYIVWVSYASCLNVSIWALNGARKDH